MSGLTWYQSLILKREIRKQYNRSYIPLKTGDSSLNVGDVLERRYDSLEYMDVKVLQRYLDEKIVFTEGNKRNLDITSSSSTDLTFKAAGAVDPTGVFSVDDAGLNVTFTGKNQMFLKVQGIHQQSASNVGALEKAALKAYEEGILPARVFIVRGIVYADKYLLVFSGSKGGEVNLTVDGDFSAGAYSASADMDFSLNWTKTVGFQFEAPSGGPLAYRVSKIRLKRSMRTEELHEEIVSGKSEDDVLDSLSVCERKALVDTGALELTDTTHELMSELEE